MPMTATAWPPSSKGIIIRASAWSAPAFQEPPRTRRLRRWRVCSVRRTNPERRQARGDDQRALMTGAQPPGACAQNESPREGRLNAAVMAPSANNHGRVRMERDVERVHLRAGQTGAKRAGNARRAAAAGGEPMDRGTGRRAHRTGTTAADEANTHEPSGVPQHSNADDLGGVVSK